MNSSGIKRGLAVTAVSALAVAGIPFLASSASAAAGDEFTFVVSGPTRDSVDAAAIGGIVVLKSKKGTVTQGEADGTDAAGREIKAIGADLSSPANNANQTIVVNTAAIQVVADDKTNPFGGEDGFDEIYVPVKVDTATTGGTASYALYLDDDATAGVQATEPRAVVTQTTAGAPASITVSPSTNSAPQSVQSANYTATVKDSAGRTTQTLGAGETITLVTADADNLQVEEYYRGTVGLGEGAVDDDVAIDPASIAEQGTFSFRARSADLGNHPITIDGPGAVDASVNLTVTPAVSGLTVGDLDVVTGADTWDGLGGGAFGVAESVRVDQTSVKVDIVDDAGAAGTNDNATISVTATGTNLTFDGGKATQTVTTTLDALAKGSVTFTPDASSINENSSISIASAGFNGGGTIELTFDRATATTVVADAQAYNTKIGQPTTVVVTAKDQYGNAVSAPAQVSITRAGRPANAGTTARQTVNAQGQATFTLADAGTTAGAETLELNLFDDQFDATATTTALSPDATINYSVEGTGPNFAVTGATADPAATTINPLYDTEATAAGDEYEVIGVDGGTANGSATFSVDGGALLLSGADTSLSKAAETKTIALDALGDGSVKVIGTKFGDVTVTIVSGGVTKTVKLRVQKPAVLATQTATARNVEVEGPEKAAANDVVAFTATFTDAFGNPVPGVTAANAVALLTGPAEILSTSGASNDAGEIVYQVQLSNSADSPVTLTVQGTGFQFGASANYLTDADDNGTPTPAPNAVGLSASENPGSATISDVVNIDELEQAVEEAQAKVDLAQDALDAAKDEKSVAVAEKQVAQKAVKAAKKDLKKAKKKHKGVAAAKKALRDARGDLKVAKAKVKAANKKVNRTKDRLADAQAELEAAEQALEDAQS